MSTLYKRIVDLCENKGIKPGRQSKTDARRADDASGQGCICLAVACVFHRVSLQKM